MNDYDRENAVAWGRAAAAYALYKHNEGTGEGHSAADIGMLYAVVEHEHTRYMVTKNTGDARLAGRAARSAAVRTYGRFVAALVAPVVLFFVGALVLGSDPDSDVGPALFCFGVLPLCVAVALYFMVKFGQTLSRNAYVRANLPTERELNRCGYWEVEHDTWFNPITNNVLSGHAYYGQEADQGRQAYRDESRQIKDLYRQMRNGQS